MIIVKDNVFYHKDKGDGTETPFLTLTLGRYFVLEKISGTMNANPDIFLREAHKFLGFKSANQISMYFWQFLQDEFNVRLKDEDEIEDLVHGYYVDGVYEEIIVNLQRLKHFLIYLGKNYFDAYIEVTNYELSYLRRWVPAAEKNRCRYLTRDAITRKRKMAKIPGMTLPQISIN